MQHAYEIGKCNQRFGKSIFWERIIFEDNIKMDIKEIECENMNSLI
jgi:hypothetical protein